MVGIAVPVAIHWFSRNHSKPYEWAAMELLRKAMSVRARRVRLEDVLIMALRALAIGLIALAFARPSLTGLAPILATGTAGTGVVIAIDGSFSMGHKPGVNRRFDLAKERVRSILDEVSPGDQVSLVLMGARPRIILRNVLYEPARFDRELEQLEPLAEPLDLAVCLDEVREMMKEIDLPRRECYIVTDAQSNTWQNIPDVAITALSEMRSVGFVSLLPIQSAGAENVAVTNLTASGIPLAGALVRYVADVHNTGTKAALDVTVRLMVDGAPVDKQVLASIAPGEILPVSLFTRFNQEGIYVIAAELGNDSLLVDNHRYLLSDVGSGIRVLCVDGSPSSQPFRGETDFLKAALRPGSMGQPASGGILLTTISSGGLKRDELQKHDIVILANLPDLPAEDAAALGDFVMAGGGLMVFVGDNTTHGNSPSALRTADGTPLLPGDLIEMGIPAGGVDGTATAWTIQPRMADHPVTRTLAALPSEQWGGILFERYIKSVPREGARVLMRLSPGDDPLLLSHRVGRGQVLLYTSSADRDWNDMVVHPAYLMMVQQSVMSLTRKSHEAPSTVSQALVFELPLSDKSSSAKIIDPAGKESQVHVSEHDGRRAVLVNSADLPGIYQMKTENGEFPHKLAVNVDPNESMTAVLDGPSLDEIAGGLSLGVVNAEGVISDAMRTNRVGREIWRALIIAALCLLVLESLLSKWLVRRVTDTSDDERTKSPRTILKSR